VKSLNTRVEYITCSSTNIPYRPKAFTSIRGLPKYHMKDVLQGIDLPSSRSRIWFFNDDVWWSRSLEDRRVVRRNVHVGIETCISPSCSQTMGTEIRQGRHGWTTIAVTLSDYSWHCPLGYFGHLHLHLKVSSFWVVAGVQDMKQNKSTPIPLQSIDNKINVVWKEKKNSFVQ
jgi:hypothetical protein